MDFPRDLHLAVHPAKLALLIGLLLGWVACVRWVDQDSFEIKMPQIPWNSGILVAGLFGTLVFFVAPFFLALPSAMAIAFAPPLIYAYLRNQKVPEQSQVLTPDHLSRVARGLFGIREKRVARQKSSLPPIRFVGKTLSGGVEDLDAVEKAEQSKGYLAALNLLYGAIRQKATDVHLEPREGEMTVRFRVDGIMRGQEALERGTGESIVNICKVLGALDITEKRKPQDGSFSAKYTEENDGQENDIDFRIATAGSLQGEKMVLRLLARQTNLGSLASLGLTDRMRKQIQAQVHQPHGMILVCGPTGSGKSTTLYACLMEIDRRARNVITLENPVEYKVPSCTQIEINEKAGKTFAGELRSVLRQDPDVILVGEIRDTETAEIACRAAQTGHLVLSTIHSNDSVTALARLLDLGVAPFLIGNSVVGILAQRLVRKLCDDCKEGYPANPEVVRQLGYDPKQLTTLYKARENPGADKEPCPTCRGSGYAGRVGVFEFLPINDQVRALLNDHPDMAAIRTEGHKAGLRSLQEDGMRLAAQGITTIQEILRVAQ